MRYARTRIMQAFAVGAALAVVFALAVLPRWENSGSQPFTQAAQVTTIAARQALASCTRAYGQCEVTEFIHVRRNGTQWIETCFTSQPVTEGHGGILVAVDYCYRP
jgi:hypothetical protein